MARAKLTRFKLNRKNVRKIAVGRECRDMVHDAAERARAVAVSFSPRSNRTSKEHYADQFEIHDVIIHGITDEWPMSRAGALLVNTSPYATEVEWGMSGRVEANGEVTQTEGHHVFGRTLEELAAQHRASP